MCVRKFICFSSLQSFVSQVTYPEANKKKTSKNCLLNVKMWKIEVLWLDTLGVSLFKGLRGQH